MAREGQALTSSAGFHHSVRDCNEVKCVCEVSGAVQHLYLVECDFAVTARCESEREGYESGESTL
jgi:hypothetical protein